MDKEFHRHVALSNVVRLIFGWNSLFSQEIDRQLDAI
jgi:hypothetical protein